MYNTIEKKAKKTGQLRKTFFKILGPSKSQSFLSFFLRKKFDFPGIDFPINIPSVKEILIILPQERVEILYQLRNIFSLVALFKHAGVTIFCEKDTASLAKMIPGLTVIEYDEKARDSYSREFTRIAKEFRGVIDICFLLDKSPNLPLLYFTGLTVAPARVSYTGAGVYPFINLHIQPSSTRKYLPDSNCAIANIFGASSEDIHWSVAPKTIEEIDHLLKESKVHLNTPLIGIDIGFFLRTFGQSWTATFIQRIKCLKKGEMYFYIEQNPGTGELTWIQNQKIPILSGLSEPRTAALISRSALLLTCNSLLYVISGLLNKPAIGFFMEQDLELYCPQTAILKGIAYKDVTDTQIIDQALTYISNFLNEKAGIK